MQWTCHRHVPRDTRVSKFLLPVVAWYASLDSVTPKKNDEDYAIASKVIKMGTCIQYFT